MPRQAIRKSESGIYHIILRGINKQIFFGDEEDHNRFLKTIKKYKIVCRYKVYAYCLISNHVHLLIKVGQEDLDLIIKRKAESYIYWYNWKYSRRGHLIQDRFKSEPVDSNEYFLTVLRYIHQNSVKAGLCDKLDDYEYSSYKEYIYNKAKLIDKELALDILGTMDFKDFNEEMTNEKCLESDDSIRRLNDKEGQEIIRIILKGRKLEDLIT